MKNWKSYPAHASKPSHTKQNNKKKHKTRPHKKDKETTHHCHE